jgi:hypothetical protein
LLSGGYPTKHPQRPFFVNSRNRGRLPLNGLAEGLSEGAAQPENTASPGPQPFPGKSDKSLL